MTTRDLILNGLYSDSANVSFDGVNKFAIFTGKATSYVVSTSNPVEFEPIDLKLFTTTTPNMVFQNTQRIVINADNTISISGPGAFTIDATAVVAGDEKHLSAMEVVLQSVSSPISPPISVGGGEILVNPTIDLMQSIPTVETSSLRWKTVVSIPAGEVYNISPKVSTEFLSVTWPWVQYSIFVQQIKN